MSGRQRPKRRLGELKQGSAHCRLCTSGAWRHIDPSRCTRSFTSYKTLVVAAKEWD